MRCPFAFITSLIRESIDPIKLSMVFIGIEYTVFITLSLGIVRKFPW